MDSDVIETDSCNTLSEQSEMEILEILKLAEPKEGIVAKANPKFGEEKEVSGCAESREIAPFIQRILEFN